jgi:hypothetical protein
MSSSDQRFRERLRAHAIGLVRPPAHAEIVPVPLDYEACSPELDTVLRDRTGASRVSRAVNRGAEPFGYYRFDRRDSPPLFGKVVDAEALPLQLAADALARSLASRGVATSMLEPADAQEVRPGAFLLTYPYVSGRLPQPDIGQCTAIGRALAGLHQALLTIPDANLIRCRAQQHRETLAEAVPLLRRVGLPRALAEAALRWSETWRMSGEIADAVGQPVHGDIHPGNLIVRGGGDSVVILDFEDATRSFDEVGLDLARLIERLFMLRLDEIGEDLALAGTKALVQGYLLHGGQRPFASLESARRQMRSGVVSAVLSLSRVAAAGRPVPAAEIRKFDTLASLHEDGTVLQRLARAGALGF